MTDKNESSNKNKKEKKTEDKDSKSNSVLKNFAVSGKKYYIDLTKPLEHLSNSHVRAYSAGQETSKPDGFFAIICDPKFTPRTNITKQYKEIEHPNLPILVDNGRAMLADGKAVYCYVYKNTIGNPIHTTDAEIAKGWKADKTLEKLVVPILNCLKDLQYRDVTHGNIRATNIYDGGSKNYDSIVLGECLSLPASLNQPVIFEPIERAMANPIGRGEGTIKDDLYSLGVLIAMYMRNYDPLRGKTNDEIISAKVVHGSYGALIGSSDRISSGLTDLLRGLLTDNEKNRWSLDNVFEWLDGRRVTVDQSTKIKKAARGIELNGTSFFYSKTFAYRMCQRPQEAVQIIESNELTHWIERSLSNSEMLERVNTAMNSAKEGGTGVGYWDRLLPRVSIAMDPSAPLRYKSMSFHMNALGNTMAYAFAQKESLNEFHELFKSEVIMFWITICADLNMDVATEAQQMEKIRGFLRKKGIAEGIERCLYFLNPSIHCLSPLVEEYFATDPTEYLISLEQVAKTKDGQWSERIIDKHAACFLMARDSKLIESHLFDLSSEYGYRYVLANLHILAGIQRFSNKVASLPYLTSWICSLLDCVIERYHDKETQKQLKKSIAAKRDEGNLYEILKILDNPEKIKKDQLSFKRALKQYHSLKVEAAKLNLRLENPAQYSEKVGREWAATISAVIAVLIALGFIMVQYGS